MKSWVGEWGTIPKHGRQWKIIFTGVGTSLTLSQQTTTGEEQEVLMIAKQPMGRLQIRVTTIPPFSIPFLWPLTKNQNGVNKIVITHERMNNNRSEMQKIGDTGDISLLFFWLVLIFGPFWVIFGPF